MRNFQIGVLANLGVGFFVANAQGGGWDIKPQPWGDSKSNDWDIKPQPWSSNSQQWASTNSESGQWSEQWKWTANQQLPTPPGSSWQFSHSNTDAPPLPPGSSSQGKWTWIPGPASGGYYWSYSSSSSASPSSSSLELGVAPGTPWQFSQSNTVAPPLPRGSSVGSWIWKSAPSGGGYYWSFIAGPKQNLAPAPGTPWIFSTSSTVAPQLPAGVSGSGTWKWVSSPDGNGYYWSFIPSKEQDAPQHKLPNLPTGGLGWIFSTSSTTPPPLPAGVSGSGSWKWVSDPNGKGFYWSFIPSGSQNVPDQKVPEPPTGGSGWIFSTSNTVAPSLPAGASPSGTWKWVSAPNGNGYYWSYISSPQSPQQQLPPPQSGSTEWLYSPSKTTPPSLPVGLSGTAGSWKWVSAPNGNGYYWSFTPSLPPFQQPPSAKPGSTGWVFSHSNATPPTISGISGSGSWTWISSQSGKGYYWSWTSGAPQEVPSGYHGGVVTPGSGTTEQQDKNTKPSGTEGTFDTKPGAHGGNFPSHPGQGGIPVQPGQQGDVPSNLDQEQGKIPVNQGQGIGSFDQGGIPVQPGQQGGLPVNPGHSTGSINQGGVPGPQGGLPINTGNVPNQSQHGGTFDQGRIPLNPNQPSSGGFDQSKPNTDGSGHVKGPFGGIFDSTGKLVTGGDVTNSQPGTHGSGPTEPQTQNGNQGQVPTDSTSSGNLNQHIKPVDTTGQQGGLPVQPATGDQGKVPITGPFGGSFDQHGKPIEGGSAPDTHSSGNTPAQQGGVPSQPPTGDKGRVPITGPFGGSYNQHGKPIEGGSTPNSHSSGGTAAQQGEIPSQPSTGDQGKVPITGPFGGSFDQHGKPIEGGSIPDSQSSGGTAAQKPGTAGGLLTPENPQTGNTGSTPSKGDGGVVKGPFGGLFDQLGKLIETTRSQGKYECPPRSHVELLHAPTQSEATCPNSQDKKYSVTPDKAFYILCCRHVDGGKKAITVVPEVPSLQRCIHICAGTPGCKSVLYTARPGHNNNYPLKSCELFAHGNYGVQTPCNNDAHDSAYLIEPPTGTSGDLPHPPVAVDPPINPPPQVDIPQSYIALPPGVDEKCAQSVFAAIQQCGARMSC